MPVGPSIAMRFLLMFLVAGMLGGCGEAPEADPRSGATRVVLDGPLNLRDLGGYASSDGRRLKPGLLYRSDSLDSSSERDLEWLRKVGIRHVYDFRSQQEVDAAPDRLPEGAGVVSVHLPLGDPQMDIAKLREQIMRGDLSGLQLEGSYAKLALQRADTYRHWFASIADPTAAPLVFHCTAGKDRTGLAAFLLLVALGVQESNMADAVAAMRADYGSVDGYLSAALGVDEVMKARLRANYLQ